MRHARNDSDAQAGDLSACSVATDGGDQMVRCNNALKGFVGNRE